MIKRNPVKQYLEMLADIAKNKDNYKKFDEQLCNYLKLIFRLYASKPDDEHINPKEYMDYMKEDQHDIYYIVGKNTDGPGMVVGEHLAETIRSHTDLLKDNDNAKHLKKALKFYTSLAQTAVECGFA
eukprot:2235036-Heterocapsa_arctica.AAC.1